MQETGSVKIWPDEGTDTVSRQLTRCHDIINRELQRQRQWRSQLKNDLITWMRKNNRAARAARTEVQFFDVVCQMPTWNFQISGFNDKAWTHNSKPFILLIYFNGASTSPVVL